MLNSTNVPKLLSCFGYNVVMERAFKPAYLYTGIYPHMYIAVRKLDIGSTSTKAKVASTTEACFGTIFTKAFLR